jgi:hypothetical protein
MFMSIRQFVKLIRNWFDRTPVEPEPEYYSWVLSMETRGVRHGRGEWVRVARSKPQSPKIEAQPEKLWERPTYIVPQGPTEVEKRVAGRQWLVSHLPDECTFM